MKINDNEYVLFVCSALQKDSLKNSHPIEVEVKHSREIDEIFDTISYNKGAAVIRMIADYLTEPVFKKGLNIYLNRHKYANATTIVTHIHTFIHTFSFFLSLQAHIFLFLYFDWFQ